MSANVPAARKELAQSAYSRWMGEGGANVTIGDTARRPRARRVATADPDAPPIVTGELDGSDITLHDGAVVIAAITSCTNTSNPSVMIGAGLWPRRRSSAGSRAKPWVKTSLAPGSRVVTDYLEGSGLLPYLEQLRFHTVGYGCTTCIGNSGPLPEVIARLIDEHSLVTAAVLSGNRNFEARVHPQVRANYLASPMLVVAFALAGRVDIDLTREPLGTGQGRTPGLPEGHLADAGRGPGHDGRLRSSPSCSSGATAPSSTATRPGRRSGPRGQPLRLGPGVDLRAGAAVLHQPAGRAAAAPRHRRRAGAGRAGRFGDHRPHLARRARSRRTARPARYLREHGVEQVDWNTFGSRRGNHEVMMRGTFGNVRIANALVPGKEGNWTLHFPTGEVISIYDAAMQYQEAGTPLVILTGKEYGTGLEPGLGRQGPGAARRQGGHRRELRADPPEQPGRHGRAAAGISAGHRPEIAGPHGDRDASASTGIAAGLTPGGTVTVTARDEAGKETSFQAVVRLNSAVELDYYRHGGILQRVLRQFLQAGRVRTRRSQP